MQTYILYKHYYIYISLYKLLIQLFSYLLHIRYFLPNKKLCKHPCMESEYFSKYWQLQTKLMFVKYTSLIRRDTIYTRICISSLFISHKKKEREEEKEGKKKNQPQKTGAYTHTHSFVFLFSHWVSSTFGKRADSLAVLETKNHFLVINPLRTQSHILFLLQ